MIIVRRVTGFTLLEVLLSLVIFLVTSAGLLPLLLTHMQANQDHSLHAQARRLAGEVMAELQVIDYDRLGTQTGMPLQENGIVIRQSLDSNGLPDGQCRITVTALWQLDGPHLYRLQTIRSAP